MKLVCTINGEKVEREADPCKRLLDFLRDDCGLTGVKEGAARGNAEHALCCWIRRQLPVVPFSPVR